ncbi:unnamed protein product [Rhizophagus irregularis]|uniref:Uncharacterized protein n=1 Tax=Rhizophagus irregularis TaxID=588596 RepID=A0A915ZB62_9GLOM|nr:unnamed protein product [Rhizophagus irregularis]
MQTQICINESANVQLITISIRNDIFNNLDDIRRLTQTLYQNCPNLRYIKLQIRDNVLTEFERLLANSQHLDGLVIDNEDNERGFNYKDVYEILTRSSPLNLSKFEFVFEERLMPNLKFLESFLNNWKDRQPILLQISLNCINKNQSDMKRLKLLILKYKREGIIKKIDFKFA